MEEAGRTTRVFAGVAVALSLTTLAAPSASAATGHGSAAGTTLAKGRPVSYPPPCAVITSVNYTERGHGSYTATAGGTTATYTGPVTSTVNTTPELAYGNPYGTHGYDNTCKNPSGTAINVTAITKGAHGSGSVSCTYTGTLSRVDPTGISGQDTATVRLAGTCATTQGDTTVSRSPTTEIRTLAYVNGSCTNHNGPPPIFCHITDSFTLANGVGGSAIAAHRSDVPVGWLVTAGAVVIVVGGLIALTLRRRASARRRTAP